MQRAVVVDAVIHRGRKNRILLDRTIGTSHVDAAELLVHDAPGADIEMTHLGVSHLALRQANVGAACPQGRFGACGKELVDIGLVGERDGVAGARLRQPKAIHDCEQDRFHLLNAPFK